MIGSRRSNRENSSEDNSNGPNNNKNEPDKVRTFNNELKGSWIKDASYRR